MSKSIAIIGAGIAGLSAGCYARMMALMNNRAAGYPIGGSLDFSRRIERRYLSLGGRIEYNSRSC